VLFECSVVDVTPLRIPRVYRVKTTCSDYEVEIELHAEVVNIPKKESKITLEITNSKDECMKHYFCAHGYVVLKYTTRRYIQSSYFTTWIPRSN